MANQTSRQQFLAIDLGAESGRGMLATYDGKTLSLTERARFPTGRGDADIAQDGHRHWDFDAICREIDGILRSAEAEAGGALAGVGADSWGVDFGLLDENGVLLQTPMQYRDASHAEAQELVLKKVSREAIWQESGIQPMPFNTIFQLAARQITHPGLLEQADCLLFMPDLVHNRLTNGESAAHGVEVTNASTSQMLTTDRSTWNTPLLDRLAIPHPFLPPIHQAGATIGRTQGKTPVFAPPTHDTASAVLSVPAQLGSNWAFLSSGTWSLIGVELPSPIITLDALNAGFSNEGGIAGSTRFLKNIMGLWLVQECRRSISRRDSCDYDYSELTALAAEAQPLRSIVDAAAQTFFTPVDMPEAIRTACRETSQPEPETVGSLIRCCLDSLALAYRIALRDMRLITGRTIDVVHIVGGGSQNKLLNQLTADACGIPVIAGPAEATAVGNVLAQMIGSGLLNNAAEARALCAASFAPETYHPSPNVQIWQDAEARLASAA